MTKHDVVEQESGGGFRSLIPFGIALVFGLAALVLLSRQRTRWDEGGDHPAVNAKLDRLEFEPLVNTSERLTSADQTGKVVLINFWGPWCGPCLEEMPHILKIREEFHENPDFLFISVSCGIGDAYRDLAELRNATEAYALTNDLKIPIYSDATAESRIALLESAEMEIMYYPTNLLLGRDQTVQALWLGYIPGVEAEIRSMIQAQLANGS